MPPEEPDQPPDQPADPPPDPPPEQPANPPQPIATVGEKAGAKAASYPDGLPRFSNDWPDGEWCSEFVKYVWGSANADTNGLTAWAANFYDYGVEHGTLHTDPGYTPQVGDAVVYNYQPGPENRRLFDGSDAADHVNIVTAVSPDGTVTLEDGNWTNKTHREAPRRNFHVGSTNDSGQVASAFISPVPLVAVEDQGVVAGPDQQPVAIAHPSALHSGGQPVVTGSQSVFVGVDRSPLAREGDRTADGGVIVDQTNENVYAG